MGELEARKSYVDKILKNIEIYGDCWDRTGKYIYFIRDQKNRIKVGKSNNPRKRLHQIQTGYPEKLTMLAIIDEYDDMLEEDWHFALKDNHIRGEWFELNREVIDLLRDYESTIYLLLDHFGFPLRKKGRDMIKKLHEKM